MNRSRIQIMLVTLMMVFALVLGGCDGGEGVGENEDVIENTEGEIVGEEEIETEVEDD